MVSMVDDKDMGYALGAADYLPKPIDRERLVRAAAPVPAQAAAPCPVLVVEDDPATRDVIRRTLEQDGWIGLRGRERPASPSRASPRRAPTSSCSTS